MSLGLSWIFSWSQVYMSYFLGRVHRNFVDFSRPIYPMDWLPEKMTSDCRLYLVGGLEQWNFMTFHIGNVIIPTDELILFRGVSSIHQPAIDSIDYALNAFWDYAMILSEVRFVNAGPKSSNIHVCFRSEIAPKCRVCGPPSETQAGWASLAPKIMNRKLEHMGRMSDRMSVSMPQNLK